MKRVLCDLLIISVPVLIRDAEQMAAAPSTAGVRLNNNFPPVGDIYQIFHKPPARGNWNCFQKGERYVL